MFEWLWASGKRDVDGAVSVLIPTMFDSRLIVELCVRSIQKRTDYPEVKIIVCDAGADEEAKAFLHELESEGSIRLIQATDWERPKDDLAAAVDTPYYVVMHDDCYVTDSRWLRRRMRLMLGDPRNAVVGTTLPNCYQPSLTRFFPLGLLVKTDAAREMGLKWGKQVKEGFDTGALAYQKFLQQTKYRFVYYKTSRDTHHFSQMTWPKYQDATRPEIGKLLAERDAKIAKIKRMLETGAY